MIVEVVFTTQIKAALRERSATVEVPAEAVVADVLNAVQSRYGERLIGLLYDGQARLLPSILICLNDMQVAPDHREPLRDGDTVTLLSAISGG